MADSPDSQYILELVVKLNTLTRDLLELLNVDKSEELDLEDIKKLYLERRKLIDELEDYSQQGSNDGEDLWSDLDSEKRDKARRLYNETMRLDEYVENTLDSHLTALENKQSGMDNGE